MAQILFYGAPGAMTARTPFLRPYRSRILKMGLVFRSGNGQSLDRIVINS
jgi:hypothetical protein